MFIIANIVGCAQLAVFAIPLLLTAHFLPLGLVLPISLVSSLFLVYWDLKIREKEGISRMAEAESGGIFIIHSYILYSVIATLSFLANMGVLIALIRKALS